jgi:hypothetical protein
MTIRENLVQEASQIRADAQAAFDAEIAKAVSLEQKASSFPVQLENLAIEEFNAIRDWFKSL